MIDVAGVSIPWISPTSWFQFLIDRGLWYRLAGLHYEDRHLAPQVWSQFWDMQKNMSPDYSLFDEPNVNYGNVAAIYLHGDEGRTLKKSGLLVTTMQSALGFGFDEKRMKRGRDGLLKLRVNYVGHTFTTRFVSNVIPKVLYESNPEVFYGMIDLLCRDLRDLFQKGLLEKRTGKRFRVAVLGAKGDAPYLQKLGSLTRAFNTGVKRGREKKEPKGVCHLCLGGTSRYPYEQVATMKPAWLETLGVKDPWESLPAVIRWLHHDQSNPAAFFNIDAWHTVHLGIGKSYVASSVQVCLQALTGTLEEKWAWLTSNYRAFCKAEKRQPHITKITGYMMSYGDHTGAVGAWSKGALTTTFLKWLPYLIDNLEPDEEGILQKISNGARNINMFFGYLFNSPAVLDRDEGLYIASLGHVFLVSYNELALHCFGKGKPFLYPMYPKLHAYHHILLKVHSDALQHSKAWNPLLTACQQDEDVIGKASRLSRRVSARATMLRTLQRYLIQCHGIWVDAGLL